MGALEILFIIMSLQCLFQHRTGPQKKSLEAYCKADRGTFCISIILIMLILFRQQTTHYFLVSISGLVTRGRNPSVFKREKKQWNFPVTCHLYLFEDLQSSLYLDRRCSRLCNIMLGLCNIIDTCVFASTSLYSLNLHQSSSRLCKTQFNDGVALCVSVPLGYRRQQRIKKPSPR